MMDATFVAKIQELAEAGAVPNFVEFDGVHFADKKLFPVEPHPARPHPVKLSTLEGTVDFIAAEGPFEDCLLVISSPREVELAGPVTGPDRRRDIHARAECAYTPPEFGRWQDQETFVTWLLSSFTDIGDRDTVIELASKLEAGETVQATDDGIGQEVRVRRGIASLGTAKTKNPVLLAPYRTFPEIEQPPGQFVLRIRQGPQLALFDADPGLWRLVAIASIRQFFEGKVGKVEIVS